MLDDDWKKTVMFELAPKDIAIHHGLILHASGWVVHPAAVNTPLPRRRGYSVHYMPASSIVLPCRESEEVNVNPLTGQRSICTCGGGLSLGGCECSPRRCNILARYFFYPRHLTRQILYNHIASSCLQTCSIAQRR